MYVTRSGKIYPFINYVRKYDKALNTAVVVSLSGLKQYIYPKTHIPVHADGLRPASRANILRRKVRDGFQCQNCGTTEEPLNVHHLDGKSYATSKQKANNNLDNLVTLCPLCHSRRHWELHTAKPDKHSKRRIARLVARLERKAAKIKGE